MDDSHVARLHAEGLGLTRIAAELGVTVYAVRQAYARLELEPQAAGRPVTGTARTKFLRIRLTPDELARVEAAGGSGWARDLILAGL